ncbi:phosphoethanolamine N-methyltransferase-like [Penaeus monodon]|uniref:phosphoethanolamine N-methyltransferase-like n=1 Tax=Penaeus monodon TaxID=6687 RepID=UPI0018A6EF51|nr:phosphoethanolamine N-methyltransferase-like [Penaeus monodon]
MSSSEPGAGEVIEEALVWQPRMRGGRILYLTDWICSRESELSRLELDDDHVTFVLHTPSAAEGGDSVPMERSTDNVKCADVNELNFPPGSFEMVVGAWILTCLSDIQAHDFLHRVLEWLVPEGYFVFREACDFHEGPRHSNSTLPRSVVSYCQMLHSVSVGSSGFTVLQAKSLLSYITYEGDPVKICFLARRSEEGSATQHAVDIRYSESFILKLEWLLGHTWVSTGGESTTREFCQRLGLQPGQRVLDVGCGSGGSAFFMSRLYGVHVHGVDISSNMIDLAVHRQTHLRRTQRKRLQFEMRDIMDADYGDCSFDVIYSRNSILHITNKEELFAKLYRWLKPGGTLFVTDYCLGSAPTSRPLADYMAKSSMSLVRVRDYVRAAARAGFGLVSEDLGDKFYNIQQKELDDFIPTQEAFVQEYSQEEFEEMVTVATNKLTWIKTRQLTWASFCGRK